MKVQERVTTSIVLSSDLLAEIDRLAKESYRNRTKQIEKMLAEAVGRAEAELEAGEMGRDQ